MLSGKGQRGATRATPQLDESILTGRAINVDMKRRTFNVQPLKGVASIGCCTAQARDLDRVGNVIVNHGRLLPYSTIARKMLVLRSAACLHAEN